MLLIDPGVQGHEMACLATDLTDSGQAVVAGFSTHPHWDHLLWHDGFGSAVRYGTARCTARTRAWLSDPDWKARIPYLIPPDIVDQVPLDLLGLITGLPPEAARIPWDGPRVRIIEHQARAAGHAALLIEDVARDVDVLVPGHGSVAAGDQVRARIDQDRAYVHALRRHARRPADRSDRRVRPGGRCPRRATPRPRPATRPRRNARLTSAGLEEREQPLGGVR